MLKNGNPKLRLLHLMQIFWEQTDEDHTLTIPQLIAKLQVQGLNAERRSIYSDIETLKLFGFDIERRKSKTHDYYLASRPFELAEVKLLVDIVQTSKFITRKKSKQLIEKLDSLTSIPQAKQMERQVYVSGRVKTENECIYYNVDYIHRAIAENRKMSFRYLEYTVEKKLRFRRNGKIYLVNPLILSWDSGYYYLIAYDEAVSRLTHYRVDKMTQIQILDQPRVLVADDIDPVDYAQRMFGMFAGTEKNVTIEFDAALAGVVVDRFGTDTPFTNCNNGKFIAHVQVAASPNFFAWVFQFGGRAKILGPTDVVQEARYMIQNLKRQYF